MLEAQRIALLGLEYGAAAAPLDALPVPGGLSGQNRSASAVTTAASSQTQRKGAAIVIDWKEFWTVFLTALGFFLISWAIAVMIRQVPSIAENVLIWFPPLAVVGFAALMALVWAKK